MWIRTKDGNFYVHEIRGAIYISWVSKADKANSAFFPKDKIDQWLKLIADSTELELEAIEPHG